MEDIDKILGFKFTLDLSDFEKAPDTIANALKEIADDAKAEGKNADIEMANYVKRMIEERENVISQLSQAMEKAKADLDKARREFASNANEETEKAFDVATQNVETLSDAMQRAKNELYELQSAENELAGNRSLINKIKLTAQNMDLYGNTMKLLPQPIANVVKAIGPLDAALKKLLANPIVLAIAAVVLAIKALADVAKGVYQYFDFMAERFDSFAYILGTVEGAVRKVVESFKALISADWESLEYNLKTMFDGGDREIERRHRKVEQAERDHQITLNNIENHWLRRRINNTALSYDERLKADKKFMENQVENFQLGKKKIEDNYKDWLDSVALYDAKLNPTGTKKDISLLSLDELEQYKKWQAAFAEAEFQIQNARAESLDRQAKIREQQFNEGMADLQKKVELWQKEKQFQRQVREQMESENRRLKQLAQQTENSVLQSQINDMAEGIEKATKQAELKAKQSLEQLNNALYDEARKLYENEKAIFEGDPNNEGKMFKAFDYSKYESRARKNIGYGIRESLISHEEMESIRKAVDEIAKKAVDGAEKVAKEAAEIETRLETLASEKAPHFFDGEFSLGIREYASEMEKMKRLQDETAKANEELMKLTRERLMLEMKLNDATTNEERVAVSKEIEENTEKTNNALIRAKELEDKLSKSSANVSNAFEKIKANASAIADGMSQVVEQFKGMNDEGDEAINMMQEMLSIVGKLASGDYIGAIIQVIVKAAQMVADFFKSQKEIERLDREWRDSMTRIFTSVADAVYGYRQALIYAKYAEEELWSNTNFGAMQKSLEQLTEAEKRLKEIQKVANERRTIEGVNIGSYLYYQLMGNGAETIGRGYRVRGSGTSRIDFSGTYYNTLETGFMDMNRRGELLKNLLNERDMEQLFDDFGNFNLQAYKALKEYATDAWNGLAEVDRQQLDAIAKVAEEYEKYRDELAKEMADWYSPLLDNMTDAWMNWLRTGEDVMDAFKDYSADTFQEILKDVLKQQLFKTVFTDFKNTASKMTADYVSGGLSSADFASQLAKETEGLMKEMSENSEVFKELMKSVDEQFKQIGIDITGETEGRTAEARGIARASQESVDENNARLAMIQQHTYSINANVMQLTNTSAQMLLQLQGIRSNTDELRRLEHIEKSLANIETYGVTTK